MAWLEPQISNIPKSVPTSRNFEALDPSDLRVDDGAMRHATTHALASHPPKCKEIEILIERTNTMTAPRASPRAKQSDLVKVRARVRERPGEAKQAAING